MRANAPTMNISAYPEGFTMVVSATTATSDGDAV